VNDLIDNPLTLPRNERGYEWERRSKFQDAFTFRLVTHDGNAYTFDIRTGEMLSSHRPWRWLVGAGLIGLVCLGVVTWLARVAWRRQAIA
jgi:CHASE1-domain containing sensor protein